MSDDLGDGSLTSCHLAISKKLTKKCPQDSRRAINRTDAEKGIVPAKNFLYQTRRQDC